MDNFYQQNFPSEEQRLNSILKKFEQDYLRLELENRNCKKRAEELENNLTIFQQISNQELGEKVEMIEQIAQIIQPSRK